jgi:hypothetical protein
VAAISTGCGVATPDYDHTAEIGALAGKADGVVPKKKWTFLVYGAADNSLAADILNDMNELEGVGSTSDVNLLAFLDTPQGASVNYLVHDDDSAALHSPHASWGARDSGDVNTLIDFVDWSLESYPAERYAVIVSGHGGGSPRVIAPDDSTGHAIAVQSLESAINVITYNTSRRIELFGADACLMQTVEVAYQLRDQASYIVASENTEPGTGWNYDFVGSHLVDEPESRGQDLAEIMIASYARDYTNTGMGATLAALQTEQFLGSPTDPGTASVATELQRLADAVATHASTPAGRAELLDDAAKVYRVYGSSDDYADLDDLLALLGRSSSQAVREQAAQTLRSLDGLVLVAWSDPTLFPRPGGVTIYFPQHASLSGLTEYATYTFSKDIGWHAALRAIHSL